MNSREALERFKELNINNKVVCTEMELNDFLMCGLLIKNRDNYVTRSNVGIDVNVIKPKIANFNLDLQGLIIQAQELAKQTNIKKVYCMNERCYSKYKEKGLIITKHNKEYYRYFENELWLVSLIG